MKQNLRKIAYQSVSGIALCLCLLSCSRSEATTDSAESGSQVERRKECVAARPALTPYSNGRARALVEKCRSGASLSADELCVAMDMVQVATDDIFDTMTAIVDSATTQVELVEDIGNKQRELDEKYMYVKPLIDILTTLTDAQADAKSLERARKLNTQIENKKLALEQYSKRRFAANRTNNTGGVAKES